jgi:hypothetical protein
MGLPGAMPAAVASLTASEAAVEPCEAAKALLSFAQEPQLLVGDCGPT